MNFYTFSDLEALVANGEHTVRFSVPITETIHQTFAELSGSSAPLHNDPAFAAQFGYAKPISYGLLSFVLAAKFEELLPGCYALGYNWQGQFRAPIYIGNTLFFCGTLSKLRKSTKEIQLDVEVLNQDQAIVATLSIKMKMLK